MEKKTKQTLIDRHLICFGDVPTFYLQTPGRIEWFGGYSTLHGGHRLTSAINRYVYASVSTHNQRTIRIISSQFPAITLTFDDVTIHMDDHPSLNMVKTLLSLCHDHGFLFEKGINIFIHSELPYAYHLGGSTAFVATILGVLMSQQKRPHVLSKAEQSRLIQIAEQSVQRDSLYHDDSLSMLYGGTNLLPLANQEMSQFQNTMHTLDGYRLYLLNIKHQGTPPWLWMKHIVDQMNTIAHHYQQEQLLTIDQLQFQFDLADLTRMYGEKTTNKVQYFFQEMQRSKQAFLHLEKNDIPSFVQVLKQAAIADMTLLEHHLPPQQESKRIASTLSWLQQHLPQCTYRLQGLGFQGPIILLFPKEDKTFFPILKKQFYLENILELKMVKHGSRLQTF